MTDNPNVLFLMTDQMRADALGIVNGWTKTPHLDRLARDGFLIRGLVSNSAECIPARFSLATGLYPHQTDVWENGVFTLNPECPNWMQALERAGYRTCLIGKTHLHPHQGDLRDRLHLMHAYGLQDVDETTGPHASVNVMSNMAQSWQEAGLLERFCEDVLDRVRSKRHLTRPSVLGAEFHYDTYVGNQAIKYLSNVEVDQTWFCWISFGGPHEPWDAPESYYELYSTANIPDATPRMKESSRVRGLLRRAFDSEYYSPRLEPEEVRAMRMSYAGNVTLIDEQIGKILNIVRERGELDRTLIVFTSDHGEMNGDQGLLYKGNFLDQAIQLPLIVKPPGAVSNGQGITATAELMDIGATIVDYAGVVSSELSCARSLRPLIEDKRSVRDFAVSEFLGHTALVNQQWKIEFGQDFTPTLLFDRVKDPWEQSNLVDNTDYGGTVADLTDQMHEFRRATPAPAVKVTSDN